MRRVAGQAAAHFSRLSHILVETAVATVVILAAALGAIGWRLSEGPWESAWLARRLEAAASTDRAHVIIGMAAVAWEGFRSGADRPLDVRVTDVRVTGDGDREVLAMPRGSVSLAVGSLLVGRLRPRAIDLEQPRFALARTADGGVSLAIDLPADASDASDSSMVSDLRAPVRRDDDPRATLLSQLRRVRVHDASVDVDDRQLRLAWRAEHAEVQAQRHRQGGLDGTASADVLLGGQTVPLAASAELDAAGASTVLHLKAGPVAPASLAGAAPALAKLSALDAPASLDASAQLDAGLNPRDIRADVTIGAGKIALHGPPILLAGATISAHGLPDAIVLDHAQATVRAHEDGLASTLRLHGKLRRVGDKLSADVSLDLDQAAMADLPILWPELTPGGARPWLTENIVAGTARRGHFDASVQGPADLSDAQLTAATGTMDADGLVVHWLRPVPPIDQGRGQVRITGPDEMEITMLGGHQTMPGGGSGGLFLRSGRMKITGIVHKDQFGVIDIDAGGSVADSIALLRVPRLHLLDKHPIDLRDPSGKAQFKLTVTLPLKADLPAEQVGIRTQAHIDDLHLSSVVAGRDLDHGALDVEATENGLKARGQALLAGIPSQIGVDMDFRAGPPSQALQTVTVSGLADERQLAANGLSAPGIVSGSGAISATLTERRDGSGAVHMEADLTNASLTAAPLDWRKPAGAPATAKIDVRLDHDKLVGVDSLSVEGDGVSVQGRADYVGGQPSVLRLDRMNLGRTEAHGEMRFPPAGGGPYAISISGPRIDLSGRFSHHDVPKPAPKPSPPPPEVRGSAWTADARFDAATMGQGEVISGVTLHADYDGLVFRRLRLDGASGAAAMHLAIEPKGAAARSFSASAADAGALLRAVDVADDVQGGRLTVSGAFNDSSPAHALAGSATLLDFRIKGAPFLAKLLQGMTLYGLVEAVQGPGLGFIKLIAPFSLSGDALDLFDARAYSASLGMTAKGRLDIAQGTAELDGTIVPAYLLNAALGNIPVIGRIFTSERGGGLFAASYSVRGPTADPDVSVNPLSVLAPGFLRGLFGG